MSAKASPRRVVAELDVRLLCRQDRRKKTEGDEGEGAPEQNGSGEFVLLQYPLLAAERGGYDIGSKCRQVRIKPVSGRIEMDIDSAEDSHFEKPSSPFRTMDHLTLRSGKAELSTSYAIGVVHDGALILSPLSSAVPLRPALDHINAAADLAKRGDETGTSKSTGENGTVEGYETTAAGGLEKAKEETATELLPLQVQVKRRETEKQAEFRVQSHAYLKQREDEEKWTLLEASSMDSEESRKIISKMISSKGQEGSSSSSSSGAIAISHSQYLDGLASCARDGGGPREGRRSAKVEGAAARPSSTAGPSHVDVGEVDTSASGGGTPQNLQDALASLVREQLTERGVCSLKWLSAYLEEKEIGKGKKARPLAASEPSIVAAAAPFALNVQGRLILKYGHNKIDDAFRMVVLSLFQTSGGVALKKSEIMHHASCSLGESVPQSMYQRVLRELCTTCPGGKWQLKGGEWQLQDGNHGLGSVK